MSKIGLATLVSGADAGFESSHLPSIVRRDQHGGLLVEMHVARPNPLVRAAEEGQQAIAIFLGPNAYIHPGWYPSKAVDHRAVPTWTYMSVHAHGRLGSFSGDDLLRHLGELTDKHESGRSAPWSLADAPDDFVEKLARAIVGIRLHVDRVEGSWKLQQHHTVANRLGLIDGLEAEGGESSIGVARAIAATLAS